MAHVELSLSEAFVPDTSDSPEQEFDSFSAWAATVPHAAEPCLLIDLHTTIRAVSTACCELLGLRAPAEAIGRPLLAGGLRLVDFSAARCQLTEQDAEKIPPLLALTSGRLARGLLRVQSERTEATVDASATPLLAHGLVAGSLTFFSEV